MGWFKRKKEGITTRTPEKREIPDGFWHKCRRCKTTVTSKVYKDNFKVCQECEDHGRLSSTEYFQLLFDAAEYELRFDNILSKDPLNFTDLKKYSSRLKESRAKTGLTDAIAVATGEICEIQTVIAAMDFSFIGGSMGSVVGEKISRAIDLCIDTKSPLIIISKSGGARMMESAFSLMQMAKTSAKLSQLAKARLPFISLLTDPTTGGVTASFAMLGDLNIAEPKALIGFAGPRVIKDTIRKELPAGFQSAEYVMKSGFLDLIVERKHLKEEIAKGLRFFRC